MTTFLKAFFLNIYFSSHPEAAQKVHRRPQAEGKISKAIGGYGWLKTAIGAIGACPHPLLALVNAWKGEKQMWAYHPLF